MTRTGTCRRAGRARLGHRLAAAGRALAVLAALAVPRAVLALEAPALESDREVATAGFYQLTWSGETAAGFELEEATRADFAQARLLYRGPDLATVLSGKPDGDYHYRIRAIDDGTRSDWSAPVHVEVRHHSLARALTFLALGAIVFIATVVLILRGEARTRS